MCRMKRSGESSVVNLNAMLLGWQLLFIMVVVISPQVLLLLRVAHAQNQTQAATDPSEVTLLNSVFEKWGISASPSQWNISGEPCSGAAIDSTGFDDTAHNPLIKCDCSFNNSTTCHITQLKVYALSVSGPIPDELWKLSYLWDLNLGQNVLTGSLSPFVGNLTRMQYLSVGINALSGELPKELGLLTELKSLGLSSNNFSGSLPSEIGNLTNLEKLYVGYTRLSGEIPPTFANLQNLNLLLASDNELSGRIPDFIGNLSKLNTLYLRGNSFEGPIPSSLSKLTSLKDLRICDVANGSSSLAFLGDMENLSILILRNNNISDSISPNIGQFGKLNQLDLSFNNLHGQIPNFLFNLSLLSFLFLGNNSLNGTLPSEKSTSLVALDVSYNSLTGSLPSWVNSQNLQLNLVGNNFTIDGSNINGLPSGLKCLQRNFPCNQGRGIYYNFSIKCGGPQGTSSSNIVYEGDTNSLGPATYYVADSERWAVSNVGYFTGSNNATYSTSTLSQVTNTLDSLLFQTARQSASSLRYYGLGLENGNYTVAIQFAEIVIDNTGWKSLGRRVFDIYVQGTRVARDFNIWKEAGGAVLTAVQKTFPATVSANYLEIHFFWAGKGTCCIPNQFTSYGPLVSAISATPDFTPTVSNRPPGNKKDHSGMIVGISTGVGVSSLVAVLLIIYILRKRKMAHLIEKEEFLGIDARPYTFSYVELRNATNDFNPDNKLGEGGFGPVFKGILDGRVIAVKQLSAASHQGKLHFVAEIATISAVQHRNLVKLYGCCIDGEKRLLVYEYLENKSLDQALFGQRSLALDWATRYNICLGIARGIAYLHEESRIKIVHRDIKASNILLDFDLTPKISDFGLAKLYDDKKTHISTRVAGTIGYLAPEYAMRGHLTEKADVFAFGVVALEVVSGRPNSDSSLTEDKIYLLEMAWNLHESKNIVNLVDSRLSEFHEEEVKRVAAVALLCTQTSPTLRPPMSRVVAMLSGDIEVPAASMRPGYLADWRFKDTTSFLSARASKSTDMIHHDTTLDSSPVADVALVSPEIASTPMTSEIIREGR